MKRDKFEVPSHSESSPPVFQSLKFSPLNPSTLQKNRVVLINNSGIYLTSVSANNSSELL